MTGRFDQNWTAWFGSFCQKMDGLVCRDFAKNLALTPSHFKPYFFPIG
jgi:hypothetical protein